MPCVSVHLVTHNSHPFLDALMRSLEAQTFRDFSVLVIDNASRDSSAEFILQEWPTVRVVKNRENLGYARAHNQAIHFTDSRYVATLNPDIVLHETFLEHMVHGLNHAVQAGSAGGKLFRLAGNPHELAESSFTDTLDSTGIIYDRKRFFRERGAGETDRGQYDHARSDTTVSKRVTPKGGGILLGPSGAAAVYRRDALEACALSFHHAPSQYFDELYFMYKEDIDLAWRLMSLGWQTIFVPSARAYHYRNIAATDSSVASLLKDHRKRSSFFAHYSYRNHLYTLIKHIRVLKMWKDAPWIFSWEAGKMLYLLFTKPFVLIHALSDIVKNWGALMERRSQIENSKHQVTNNTRNPNTEI